MVITLILLSHFSTTDDKDLSSNGQSSNWKFVKACVPQVSVLRVLFFLIYIHDFWQGPTSDVKLFAENTSLFSIVNCAKASAAGFNSDLLKIQDWANQ